MLFLRPIHILFFVVDVSIPANCVGCGTSSFRIHGEIDKMLTRHVQESSSAWVLFEEIVFYFWKVSVQRFTARYPPQKKKITFSTFCLAQFELEYETFYWMGIIIFVIYCAAYTRAYYFFSLLFIIFKSKCIIHSLCLYFLFRVLK